MNYQEKKEGVLKDLNVFENLKGMTRTKPRCGAVVPYMAPSKLKDSLGPGNEHRRVVLVLLFGEIIGCIQKKSRRLSVVET